VTFVDGTRIDYTLVLHELMQLSHMAHILLLPVTALIITCEFLLFLS